MTAPEPWHGTWNGYTNRKCRCDNCKAAARTYRAKWRAKVQQEPLPQWVEHGSVNAATNYQCPCRTCKDTRNARERDRYQRRQAAK